jgi:hypothetical protein
LRDPGNAGQSFAQKILEGGERGDEDAQLVVRLAGHEVAVHDLGKLGDRAFESREVGIVLLIEADAHEGVDRQAHGFGLHQRDIAGYDPALLQRAYPAQAWAGAEANILAELLVGEAAVVLEPAQDIAVNRI